MKIIILGAGEVGVALANHLAAEHNDITIIDNNAERLRSLRDSLDILTITGHASYPDVLQKGGAQSAELLIAVTSNDEVNLAACQIAAHLFQIPTKIARIRSQHYLAYDSLFSPSGFSVDVLISPEKLISDYITRLIEYPGVCQVLDFADQALQLIAIKIQLFNASLIGEPIKSLETLLKNLNIETEIATIFRDGAFLAPTESIHIELNDEIFFLAPRLQIKKILSFLNADNLSNHRIIIAGGGNIGTRLASCLEKNAQVKIIEKDLAKAETLATRLSHVVVLQGDASDKSLLKNEDIENTDIFCAVTNQDETNIMSALLAKRLGVHHTIALIRKSSYLDVIEGKDIDIVISPQQITIGSLLTHIRHGNVVNVHSLKLGSAEVIEMLITHDTQVIGKSLEELSLPKDTKILALIRDKTTFLSKANPTITVGDRVIILILDKRKIHQIGALFQGDLS